MNIFGLLLLSQALSVLGAWTDPKAREFPEKLPLRVPRDPSEMLQIHLVPHTHDDTGWLKTVDQYFVGGNNSIQRAGVQYILDTLVDALLDNPDRQFIYVEQAFFQRWWRQQDVDMQATVQGLVAKGQLEFVNGGWCMHDEAAAHYIAMIDQTTLGHMYLKQQFNFVPTVGWQIDPFGHSASQAALLSAKVGFDALFFGRIDYQDRQNRLNDNTMEFVWSPSPSYGSGGAVFSGAFLDGNYQPPSGFCYDDMQCSDPPMQTDPAIEGYNVQDRVNAFVEQCYYYANYTEGNNIMMKMGSDFQYQNAVGWYTNLDQLIEYVNQDGRVNVFYSTPSKYVAAKLAENITWTMKYDDFFPYADNTYAMWSGYFTSRPALKRNVRVHSNLLNQFRQLEVIAGIPGNDTQTLWEEVSVAQHHDAVSGTSKQHVAYDYAARIAKGYVNATAMASEVFSYLLGRGSPGPAFTFCPQLNESTCALSQNNQAFAVVYWNSRARQITEVVQIPVSTPNLAVFDYNGNPVTAQVLPTQSSPVYGVKSSTYTLYFSITLPGLGYGVYFVQPTTGGVKETHYSTPQHVDADQIVIQNSAVQLTFSNSTGKLQSYVDLSSGLSASLQQEFFYYESYVYPPGTSGAEAQNSGAYIFRPVGTEADPACGGTPPTLQVFTGPVVSEVRQTICDWIVQTTRLSGTDYWTEMRWSIGSIPIDDGVGKEVIARYTSNINNGQTYFTDANGREMQNRTLNYRPTWNYTVYNPISGNYFPVNAVAFLNDTSNRQFTLLTDRSLGSASLNSGELEMMLHRRTLHDDGRGVGEPINETQGITPYPLAIRLGPGMGITGSHFMTLSPPSSAASRFRPSQYRFFSPPLPSFTPMTASPNAVNAFIAQYQTQISFLGTPLPANIELITFQAWYDGTILLRLSHQFAVGEDPVYSQPTTVDLTALFTFSITSCNELSLTANQDASDLKRPKYKVQEKDMQKEPPSSPTVINKKPDGTLDISVTLNPMEIKTFSITISALDKFKTAKD